MRSDDFEVAYILLRFPHLTETFVADEIWELKQQGVRVRIASLLQPRSDPIHSTSRQLQKDVVYAPELLSVQLWRAQIHFLVHSPFQYMRLLIQLLRQPYVQRFRFLFPRRVLIFLKAVTLAYALRTTKVRSIHSHFAWLSGAAGWLISSLLDIPLTVTVHAYDIYSSNDLLCLVSRNADHIIAISEFNKQEIRRMCPGLTEDSFSIIHCGIYLDSFSRGAQSKKEETLSILSVGSLIEKKGHEYLIRACGELAAQGIDFQCTIIGRGEDERQLQDLIEDLNLENQVILAGGRTRSDVVQAYEDSDVFVLACAVAPDGDRDGIPVVLMEALAMQLPSVSTDVSGIPELIRHEKTGLVVPERDATALADAILRLAHDKHLCTRLGKNGRALVESEFDIRRNVQQLMSVFAMVQSRPDGL